MEALGLPVRTALLKGRASYLCLHRLAQARQADAAHDGSVAQALARIEQWAQATRTGDLAELPGLDERSGAMALVTSTRDNCLGSQCPQFRECHVNLARREALAADVVVINHHLFFADLAVRESGMAELLPTVRVVVFDEAHQVNETGVLFLGVQLGSRSCWILRGICWRQGCRRRVAWRTGRACVPRWSVRCATCAWWPTECRMPPVWPGPARHRTAFPGSLGCCPGADCAGVYTGVAIA